MTITITKQELQDILAEHTAKMIDWKEKLIPAILQAVQTPNTIMSPIDQIRATVAKHLETFPQIKFL